MATAVVKKEPGLVRSTYQICRLCLSEDSLDDVFKEEDLPHWISEYLSITINTGDSMSQAVCVICRIRLTEFHQFRVRCQEVQDVLQTLEQNDNTEADSELLTLKMVPRYGCTHCGKMFVLRYHLDQHAVIHAKVIPENQPVKSDKQYTHTSDEIKEHKTNPANLANNRTNGTSNHENDKPRENSAVSGSKKSKKKHAQNGEKGRRKMNRKKPTIAPTVDLEDMIDIEDIKIEADGDDDVGLLDASIDQPSNDMDTTYAIEEPHINDSPIVPKKTALHREKTVPCKLCHKKFRTNLLLWNHNRRTHGPKKFKCRICKNGFPLQKELDKHKLTNKHLTNQEKFLEKQKSNELKKSQIDETENLMRQIIDSNEEEYTCPTCNRTFKRQCQFKAHMMNHISKLEDEQLSDEEESDSEPEEAVPENSTPTEQPSEPKEPVVDKPWKCSKCHRSYSAEAKLKNHQRFHKPKNFKCPICERPFLRQGLVDKHVPTHNAVRTRPTEPSKRDNYERPYKCDICHKAYMSDTALCGHKRQVHGPRIHGCHICGFKFSLRKDLRRHVGTHYRSNVTSD